MNMMSFDGIRKRIGSSSRVSDAESKKNKIGEFENETGDMEVGPIINQLLSALQDDRVTYIIANALAKIISPQLKETITQLETKVVKLEDDLHQKSDQLSELQDKYGELEQYGRREGIRISGIEDTDSLVYDLMYCSFNSG
ncbi:hypothetical protein LOTGIDRAFT_158375 [Lottia gigantea]|uniref:Uncharacterized protein n=1 Tax=Lottia gigantea TaxID=225164 RepID=V4AW28_LOTGI|nr:hypothetical protein LOTGIDRAFT_158375 [Lottia gigantea]ESO99295.1 hypothetical protein LOTGIDRAFT_158375 [Lottia gigantea]